MKRLVLALATLVLAACQTTAPVSTAEPAPISSGSAVTTSVCQTVNLQKLDLVWRAYDVAMDAIDLLIVTKVIKPGSVKAKMIADANDRARAALLATEHARDLCDATTYARVLDEATRALADLRVAIGSKG